MTIPLNINNLTVEQWIKFEQAKTEPEPNLAILRALLGLSYDEVNNMPLNKLNKLIFRVQVLRGQSPRIKRNKAIWIGFKRFKGYSNLCANQFTALDTFKMPEHMANACAVCYGRGKFDGDKVNEYSLLFAKQKIGKVYGQVFFCTNVYKKLKEDLKQSLATAKLTILEHLKEISQTMPVSDEIMDGIMSLTSL